eukprot:1694692-Rhodomonas_salina.1
MPGCGPHSSRPRSPNHHDNEMTGRVQQDQISHHDHQHYKHHHHQRLARLTTATDNDTSDTNYDDMTADTRHTLATRALQPSPTDHQPRQGPCRRQHPPLMTITSCPT